MTALGLPGAQSLSKALQSLQVSPCPHVPNPPGVGKRASVALVLRVRPSYADSICLANQTVTLDEHQSSAHNILGDFFAQDWVQGGQAEILFIKRAGRVSDRWSGHVAFPGGRRDPPDLDDCAAAIRETREEVGLDLTMNCIYAGNLPERVVTTSWGKQP
jgi:8-oxo-dGTP pyrophosphatase MutT (NUDIX family)